MLKTFFSDGNLTWLSGFFFEGDYPLVWQLMFVNGLALVVFVIMKMAGHTTIRNPQGLRMLFWAVISTNILLVMNKDFRFIGFLA